MESPKERKTPKVTGKKILPISFDHMCGGLKTLYVLWSRVKQVSLFKFPYRFPQWQLFFSDLDLSTFAELLLLEDV